MPTTGHLEDYIDSLPEELSPDTANDMLLLRKDSDGSMEKIALDTLAGESGAPSDASYVTLNTEAGLSAETPHPELYDASTGTPIDMSGAATGTGVSASTANGLTAVSFTNGSWQYWDVDSAIGTGNFDVRMRVTSQMAISPKDGTNTALVLFCFALSDSGRTFSTALTVLFGLIGITSGVTPTLDARIDNATQGKGIIGFHPPAILRIARTGTAVSFYYSLDEGRTWGLLATATSSLNIAKIGAVGHANNTGGHSTQVHWIKSV